MTNLTNFCKLKLSSTLKTWTSWMVKNGTVDISIDACELSMTLSLPIKKGNTFPMIPTIAMNIQFRWRGGRVKLQSFNV